MAEKDLPVVAWIDGEADAVRLVPAKTMHSAKRAGGTALTALHGYQPLVRLSDAQAAVAQWRDAVDAELMQIESTVDSFVSPTAAIRALIDFYVMADRLGRADEAKPVAIVSVWHDDDGAACQSVTSLEPIGALQDGTHRLYASTAPVAALRAENERLRVALKAERDLRILGQEPDVHWESLRERRRDVYAATDAALAAEKDKGQET